MSTEVEMGRRITEECIEQRPLVTLEAYRRVAKQRDDYRNMLEELSNYLALVEPIPHNGAIDPEGWIGLVDQTAEVLSGDAHQTDEREVHRLRETLHRLVCDLEEVHQDEVDADHYGDDRDECSYCLDMDIARAALGHVVPEDRVPLELRSLKDYAVQMRGLRADLDAVEAALRRGQSLAAVVHEGR